MKRAFTLIEMAIVLVIIALVVAAIVGGRNMLETAKLNSIISDLKNYKDSSEKFKEIYSALPGDMPDATEVIDGAADNGNGNSILDIDSNFLEHYLFWNHLALAGLIDGKYNGDNGGDIAEANSPSGPFPQSYFFAVQAIDGIGFNASWVYLNKNSLNYGKTCSGSVKCSLLRPEQAQIIDSKMDDGNGITGEIAGISGADMLNDTYCTNAGAYKHTQTTPACIIFYRLTN